MPWLLWIASSLLGSAVFAWVMTGAEDKTLFMPGPLSSGHHQLADSCESCHIDAFGGTEILQSSCESCHGDERVKPFDSHPAAKFADPRNADRLEAIDARTCVTCHVEHQPEHTLVNGLTQPGDFCMHCHEDIGTERPSHEELDYMTCASSGCHNYHDNRALYTDFLIKHADGHFLNDDTTVPKREFSTMFGDLLAYPRDQYPIEPLDVSKADVPADVSVESTLLDEWANSSHAASGVNCTACHRVELSADVGETWHDAPGAAACVDCHDLEVETFGKGKHGMRLAAGLSPLQPAMARMPMHDDADHEELGCASCHVSHEFDTVAASVDACLGCHADEHTMAYEGSPHHQLWLAELAGVGEPGSGVSCATCHMPRVRMDADDWNKRIVVDHNQNASLAPNSKMIRPVCMECHGLGFAIDVLSDRSLVESNYSASPVDHVPSIDMAVQFREDALRRKAEAQSRK